MAGLVRPVRSAGALEAHATAELRRASGKM